MSKEVNLMINQKGELNFSNPEPYITINVLTKETYEKLIDIIDKHNAPMNVEVKKITYMPSGKIGYSVHCPECGGLIVEATRKETIPFSINKHCPYCGQVVTYGEV